ncbi:transposable element Tc3 transposase [Trichonephila clavipes]|nr:transposable element Tc3 transposase [Trichonephila clavipes]
MNFFYSKDNLVALHFKYHQARCRFVEWAQNEIAVVPDFHKRILFSDEAHFWLKGYVNKQSCRIWSEANSQVYVETPLHPEKLTVWCVYGLVESLELWFQQDGATCHTACTTIDLLKDTFGDRLISRFGHVNCFPRSCDLTPLDYFLWGYVKSLVYADKPQTLDHLEDKIRSVIADIRSQMLEKVIENWTYRLDYIRASRGSSMPEIIFKMGLYVADELVRARVPSKDEKGQMSVTNPSVTLIHVLSPAKRACRSFYFKNKYLVHSPIHRLTDPLTCLSLIKSRVKLGITVIFSREAQVSGCRNCGGGDRGRVAIYRPFGELRRAKIVLSPVRCSRSTTGVPLAHATMNFVGLDLTASDRWHQKTTTTTYTDTS